MKNIAIITGSSSGMGQQFVLQLENYFSLDEVWVIARRKERLEQLQNFIKTNVVVLPLDLLLEDSFAIISKKLEEEKPNVKLLVNCAGHGKFGDFDASSLNEDLETIDLNNRAYVIMTRITLPYMDKGSYIVNLASMSSYQPVPYMLMYGASKAFTLSYSRGLNKELKPKGIRALAVTPLYVRSEFFNYAYTTNQNNRVQYYNYLYSSKDVVKKAYKDLLKSKKDVSILGKGAKFQRFFVKILPTKWIMDIWCKQQKKPKNNENLFENDDLYKNE